MVPFHSLIICFLSSIFFIIEVVIIIDWYFVYVLLFIYLFPSSLFYLSSKLPSAHSLQPGMPGGPSNHETLSRGNYTQTEIEHVLCFMERWPGYADVWPPGCGPDRQSLRFTNGPFLIWKLVSILGQGRACFWKML